MNADQALHELYGADPAAFVSTRDRLAKALKAAGDAAAAKELKAVRKPPLAVWAVNQLSRRHPGEVTSLLEAGDALRRAQRKALSGVKAAGLREAAERRARAADRLGGLAAAILAAQGAAPATHLPAVHTALVAAAADEDVAEALRRGLLDALPEPPSGFGEAAGLSLVPDLEEAADAPAEAGPAQAEAEAEPPAPKGPTAAERKALAAARRKAQDAAARAAQLAVTVRAAATGLKEAEQEVKDAERRARQARRDADRARRALERAQAEAKAAEAASRRAAATLRDLEGGGG